MLLNEVGQDQADWYLIARDGNLTVKVSAGLCVGEDESGLLLLNPTPDEALIRFAVDNWGRLQIQPASDRFALLSPQRNYCATYQAEPYQGLSLWLPNNQLDLANDIQGVSKQYDDLPLTLVPNAQPAIAATYPEAGAAAALHGAALQVETLDAEAIPELILEPIPEPSIEPGPEPMLDEPEFRTKEIQIPVLDSPIERVREPDPSETLITTLPYGFEPRGFTTTQTVAVPIDVRQRHRLGTTSRVTVVLAVILVGVAAGLMTAKLNLIDSPLRAPEQRTAFNPATPRLVLLSEAQTQSDTESQASAAVVAGEPTTQPPPEVPLTPPEITPATPPAARAVAPAPSGPTTTASVFRTDLADASELFAQGFITAPAERNTVAILSRILLQDPEHPEANLLLKRCADRMIDAAVEAEQHGLEFEARNLVEEVMAFYPQHPQAEDLWQQWTDTSQGV